jgi:hypothetical protein
MLHRRPRRLGRGMRQFQLASRLILPHVDPPRLASLFMTLEWQLPYNDYRPARRCAKCCCTRTYLNGTIAILSPNLLYSERLQRCIALRRCHELCLAVLGSIPHTRTRNRHTTIPHFRLRLGLSGNYLKSFHLLLQRAASASVSARKLPDDKQQQADLNRRHYEHCTSQL